MGIKWVKNVLNSLSPPTLSTSTWAGKNAPPDHDLNMSDHKAGLSQCSVPAWSWANQASEKASDAETGVRGILQVLLIAPGYKAASSHQSPTREVLHLYFKQQAPPKRLELSVPAHK